MGEEVKKDIFTWLTVMGLISYDFQLTKPDKTPIRELQ